MKLEKTILRVARETGVDPESLALRTSHTRRAITAKGASPTPSHKGKIVNVPFVFLEFAESAARLVCIAGTFNDWRPGATRMIHMGDGVWVKELSLPPGNYE